MDSSVIVSIFIGFFGVVYAYFKYKYSYWSKLNVPHLEPEIPFGNMKGIGSKIHFKDFAENIYNSFKGKFPIAGMYVFANPTALALDLDLVKNILIKDFHSFKTRGIYYNEKHDPMSATLVSLEPVKWKALRSKLTPTFTSGKMKFMFPTILDVTKEFVKCMNEHIEDNTELELRELLGRYTTDIIGTCAFGIECNSLKNPDAIFRTMGRKHFEEPKNGMFARFLIGSFPKIAKLLKRKTIREDVSAFFLGIVDETVEYREKNKIRRNDFMDLLIQLKNDDRDGFDKLTLNEIAAQAFVFFLAGFETSSTTMSFSLYSLALNLDIQDKLRKEINEVLLKHNGELSYEAMLEMHYLENVINEVLRMYSPVSNLTRQACEDYRIPDTNVTIKKNSYIWVPVSAIHYDADIYPNPTKFDPDRFAPEEVKKRHPMAHLPFGDGPRNCIGLRFGMMQTKIGLIHLIKNYKFTTCSKTSVPLVYSRNHIILTPVDGLWLNVNKI